MSTKTKPASKSAAKTTKEKPATGKNRLPEEKVAPKKKSKVDWAKIKRDIDQKVLTAYRALRLAMFAENDAKEEHKSATKWAEQKQIDVNALLEKLEQINKGTFQPGLWDQKLPKKSENGKADTNGHAEPTAATTVDEGAKQPLSVLLEFKHPKTDKPLITASMIDKVKDVVGATVGDLEKFQADNQLDWVKKISGLGNSADGLNDALSAFRRKFSVPDQTLTQSEKAAKAEKTPVANGEPVAEGAGPKLAQGTEAADTK